MYNAPNCNDITASWIFISTAIAAHGYTAVMCGLQTPSLADSDPHKFWIQLLTVEIIQLLHTKFGTQTDENVFIVTISLEKSAQRRWKLCFCD